MAMPKPQPHRLTGRKGKKQSTPSSRPPIEAPNTLQSKTTGRIIDVLSEGEIGGLVNGHKSIILDGTALQNADGTYNFQGVVVEERYGLPDQTSLSGFPAVEAEVQVGAEVVKATPVVRTVTNPSLDALRLKIRVPAIYQTNASTGDMNTTSVELKIEVKPAGGSYSLASLQNSPNPFTIDGKNTSAYEESYRIPLPPGGAPWDIRVTRITDDSAVTTLQNQTYWSTYTEIIDHKLSYPYTALIGISVDASLFGSEIPERSYEIYGIKIQVPSNYNATTRQYTGIWDLTFQTVWSNNPAWILYDILTNRRYGLGEYIDTSQIHKETFYTIGQYCDELVPDGQGGFEPRFTMNVVLNSQLEAYDAVNLITSCFRGMSYWANGLMFITCDMPSDPVKLVNQANVIEGKFDYSGTALKSRHTAAHVSWNDPDNAYEHSIEVYEDQDLINQYGRRVVDVAAYGCTSRGQARRMAKWILDSERYETEMVTYNASWDHADVLPGDLVKIADPDYAGIRLGGRIVDSLGETSGGGTPVGILLVMTQGTNTGPSQIQLDAPYPFELSESYTFSVVLPDNTIEDKAIINPEAVTDLITLASPLSTTPVSGAMWVITASNVEPRQFRVLTKRETEKHNFEITALFHDPSKYARVEDNLVTSPAVYSALPTGALIPPKQLACRDYVYQAGPSVKSAINIGWLASTDPRTALYEVTYKGPTDPAFRLLDRTSGTSIEFQDTQKGDYIFQVYGLDRFGGLRSQPLTGTFESLGLLAPPDDVSDFNINVLGENAYLSWKPVSSLDVHHYVIKYSPQTSGANWSTANLLIPQVGKDTTAASVQSRSGTYLIKAVDSSGVESVNETLIVSEVGNINNFNAVTTLTYSPTFSGTKTDCTVVSGALQLTSASVTEATYEPSGYYDLGAVYVSRFTPNIIASGTDLNSNVDDWVNIDDIANWDGGSPGQWAVKVEIQTTEDNPAGTPTWSDWKPVIVGDYKARAVRPRLKLYSYLAGISPSVTTMELNIDMPDRIEKGDDISSGTGVKSVVFGAPFKEVPTVVITAQNLSTGDYYNVSNKTASGFDVQFFNAAGTGISKTFDFHAVGFGYQS